MTLADKLFLVVAFGGLSLYGLTLFTAWILVEVVGGKGPAARSRKK